MGWRSGVGEEVFYLLLNWNHGTHRRTGAQGQWHRRGRRSTIGAERYSRNHHADEKHPSRRLGRANETGEASRYLVPCLARKSEVRAPAVLHLVSFQSLPKAGYVPAVGRSGWWCSPWRARQVRWVLPVNQDCTCHGTAHRACCLLLER